MTNRNNARESILDAAGKLIAEKGVNQFSFDSLARQSGVSRGGILYHFASKEILIQAMLDRLMTRFEAILEEEVAQDADPHGRFTRAFAHATFKMDSDTSAVFSAIIAAIAYDPHLLDPLRDRWQALQSRSESELPMVVAAVVQMASQALWLNGIFGMAHYTPAQQSQIIEVLDRLIQQSKKD